MSFKIGDIIIKNKVVLAPMAGISNSPFRVIVKKMGVGLLFAEMISDRGLFFNNEKTKKMLYITQEERPIAQQIFGSDVETMLEAALYIDKNVDCDIIDINLGCPVPKVAIKAQAGAGLMKQVDKIYELVKTIVENVSKPVTCKIRSGWDEKSINAVEVAKVIEKAGAKAITIHARTRSQGYSGNADWSIIKQVKEAVTIPVIGNGDVIDGKSAKKMLDETNCDAVMVGRKAMGNPWVFKEINAYLNNEKYIEPSFKEIKEIIIMHMNSLIDLKGEELAMLEMRSHGSWYFKGLKNSSYVRRELNKVKTKKELIILLEEYEKRINKYG